MKIARVAYYTVLALSALFFAYELAWSFRTGKAPDKPLVEGGVMVVGATAYGIMKADKQYLIGSMPLRMFGCVSAALSFILLMRTFYLS